MEMARLADARRSGVTVSSFNTQYTGLRTSLDETAANDDSLPLNAKHPDVNVRSSVHSTTQELPNRSWLMTVLTTVFSLLWLAPMLTLLALNLKQQVIGASAWCPFGHCSADTYSSDTSFVVERLHKLDERNHNLLGALQLVAKALEVWFIFIVGLLIYLLTMMLAEGRAGIPVAYLMRPSEFAELPTLFDPLFWRTLPPLSRRNPNHGALGARTRIWIFVFGTVFLAILCNLMGPAAAVLVIPSLQWIDTDPIGNVMFGALAGANPPSTTGSFYNFTYGCTEQDFNDAGYSCDQSDVAVDLDGAIQGYLVARGSTNAINQENTFTFTFNFTDVSDGPYALQDIWWSPNRPQIRKFADDYLVMTNISTDVKWAADNSTVDQATYNRYLEYNNSLSVTVVRNGPIIGAISNTWMAYNDESYSETIVSNDKTVRCYANYNLTYSPFMWGPSYQNYTRCVKLGDGWNTDADHSCAFRNFSIAGIYRTWQRRFGPSLNIETWSSGMNGTAFLPNGTLPSLFDPRCLTNGTIPQGVTCDWEKFFAINMTSPVYNRTLYSNTIQVAGWWPVADDHPRKISFAFDFNALGAFTDYTWDPSPLTNPLRAVQQANLPIMGYPLPVHPDWTLAAWSVDNNGSLPANRTATIQLLQLMDDFWDTDLYYSQYPMDYYYDSSENGQALDTYSIIPILQTLSLMDYSTSATLPSNESKSLPASNPTMTQSARLNVWTYGMYSRTAYFGVAVAIIGCIVVLLQVILGLVDRREFLSPTQLLVAALEHTPQAEFVEHQENELAMAKVRFRVRHVHETAGKLRFRRAI